MGLYRYWAVTIIDIKNIIILKFLSEGYVFLLSLDSVVAKLLGIRFC
jgi:hypothetical protein